MTLVSMFAPAHRGARRTSAALLAGFAATIVAAAPAAAQQAEPGAYLVARAGLQVDSDVKPTQVLAKGQTVAKTTPTLPRNVDHDAGFTGELGMGYDFGGIRLEGTAGYDTANVNVKALSDKKYAGAGRTKSFDLGVAAYVDLVRDGPFKPFVGAGIGASRVNYSIDRHSVDKTPGTLKPAVGIIDKDWGFRWHLDAGVNYDIDPKTSFELLGRYSQTSGMKIEGAAIDENFKRQSMDYKLKNASTSIMVGLRQKF